MFLFTEQQTIADKGMSNNGYYHYSGDRLMTQVPCKIGPLIAINSKTVGIIPILVVCLIELYIMILFLSRSLLIFSMYGGIVIVL